MKVIDVDYDKINPFVRLVQKISGTHKDYYVPWRLLYDFEFMFITEGNFVIKTENSIINLKIGDFVLIPPFLLHKQMIPEGESCSYYAIHFDIYDSEENNFSAEEVYCKPCEDKTQGTVVEPLNDKGIYRFLGMDLSSILHINGYSNFKKIFEKIYELYEDVNKGILISSIELKALVIHLIFLFLKEENKNDFLNLNVEESIREIVDFINKHFSENIVVEKLANKCAFSVNYFRKVFKKYVGCTPTEYVENVRLKEAKRLLKTQKYTAQIVSDIVGYNDSHYFSRVFKKKVGVPPAAYRKMKTLDE